MEKRSEKGFVSLCNEVNEEAESLLRAAESFKQILENQLEIEKEKKEKEREKLQNEIKKEKEWSTLVAKNAIISDNKFYTSLLMLLWELSKSPSNCKKIILTEHTIESIVSYIQSSLLEQDSESTFLSDQKENNMVICFGILCNICSEESNRESLIQENLTEIIQNAIVCSKNLLDIIESYDNRAKQIISFLNNSSKYKLFNQTIIQIGYVECLTSAIYRFNEDVAGIDLIINALTSIYYNYMEFKEDYTETIEISQKETDYLLNTLEQSQQFTSGIINLISMLKTKC